jgi:Tfp pilus assembly protein PilO
MRALYSAASTVPIARVAREQRAWLMPIGVVLAINLAVLVGVVLPLTQSVDSGDKRAAAAAQGLSDAQADFKNAEATRDGQAQADRDLDRFYRQVLPADVAAARRITHLRLSQLAREHDVTFQQSAAVPEVVRDSQLERLKVSYGLSGNYDDIRQFIYDIETGPDFVVIDNVVLSEGADGNAPLSLNLDLSTFYRVTPNDR